MSGGSAPAAPNYGPIAAANERAANLQYAMADKQFQWAKARYWEAKPMMDRVQRSLVNTLDENTKNAREDRARYEQIYQPIEDKQAKDAKEWDSPGRMAINRGRSAATVAQTFDAAEAASNRQLESFGVDPSTARFAGLNRGAKLARAAASAGAQNQSDVTTQAQAVTMRDNAINTGKGYPAQVAGAYQTGMGAGTGAAGVSNQTSATFMPALGNPVAWQGLGNQSTANWTNVLNSQYAAQLSGFNANQNTSSGIGSALGAGLGIASMFLADGGSPGDAPVSDGAPSGGPPAAAVPRSASIAPGMPGDTVPAMLEPDEMVIPKRAVLWLGQKHFQKMIEKTDEERQGATAKPVSKPVPAAVMRNPRFVSPGAMQHVGQAVTRRAA